MDTGPVKLAVLITSFWDHPGLDEYYANLQISFPYTVSQNYVVWEEIPVRRSLELLGSIHSDDPIQAVYGKLLHEIAGGNPMVMLDILKHAEPGPPSVATILSAAEKAAQEGCAGKKMLRTWKKLPPDSLKAIEELLALRQVPVETLPAHLERLRLAGIISERMILGQRYVVIRSWFVELVVRLHAVELGIGQKKTSYIDYKELVPAITVVHQDAYLIIHEIENLLRNFIVTHLAADSSDGASLLSDHLWIEITKYPNGKPEKFKQDAQMRAEQWRERSREHGLPVHLNPDIAYLSLNDLGGLIEELGKLMGLDSWLRVAKSVEQVVYIRDAVMHNQIIEISDLRNIYDLQNKIYSALSEISSSLGI